MVRFKSLIGRATGRRPAQEEQYVFPYNHQPESPAPSSASLRVPQPAPSFTGGAVSPDSKVDLNAIYSSPEATSDSSFTAPPPGYVTREPSTTTPPYQTPQVPLAATTVPAMPDRPSPPIPTPSTPAHDESYGHYAYAPPPTQPAPAAAPRQAQPSPSPKPPAPGDLPLERAAGQKITAEELHELGDMIRQRYQLDIQIHSERFLRQRDRDITQAKIRKAEALLDRIRRTVITWDRPEYFEHGTGDYEAFQEIARRIHLPGKRDWVNEPPWVGAGVGRPERRRF